ncbi:MAG TPA: VCBS repeat-containing protein [Vicinamibacterales bacterium]|nr:VCBS repeat-containing protein [Vicinamibacterales bacterium]
MIRVFNRSLNRSFNRSGQVLTARAVQRRTVVLVLALTALASASARAATVTGTFTYAKVVNGVTGASVQRPIAFAYVEIYTKGYGFFDTWGFAGSTVTDATGAIRFTDPLCHIGNYDVRIYSQNYAAVVIPKDQIISNGAFSTEPGRPNTIITHAASSCSDTFDFSSDFTDVYTSEHFNLAEAVRRAFDYASARRDPRETDPLTQAAIQPSSVSVSSWYNYTVDQVVINNASVFDDAGVIHEYGHWLEKHLSTFAPIAAIHDGCTARDVGNSYTLNTPGHAWMEGFADYFAQAVVTSLPTGTLISAPFPQATGGTTPLPSLETPPPCNVVGTQAGTPGNGWIVTASAVEDNVAAILWDLTDRGSNESFDVSSGQGTAIFQIFDRELTQLPWNPRIEDFYCAWVARGLQKRPIDLLFANRGIPLPWCSSYAERMVWRPSTGEWLATSDSGAPMVDQQWGMVGDIPVPGFYDGDGIADFAIFRPSTGEWWIKTSMGGDTVQVWGGVGDVPVQADYDNDGITDIAFWRPSTGTWHILQSSAGYRSQQLGIAGDVPVPGDYDGDGKIDLAVWRPGSDRRTPAGAPSSPSGMWYVINSSTGAVTQQQWGTPGDIPVPADYDGDGKTDFAVWRPSSGTWFVINSGNGVATSQQWGTSGDVPVPGQWDGDGRADLAVWRPSSGQWLINTPGSTGARVLQWGLFGDVPIKPGPRYTVR